MLVGEVGAELLVVGASSGGRAYPLTGSRSAAQFVDRALVTNDTVFIENTHSMYPYAVASHLHLVVLPQQEKVAFKPEFRDPRFHYIAFTGNLGNKLLLTTTSDDDHQIDIARAIGRADRVFLYVDATLNIPRAVASPSASCCIDSDSKPKTTTDSATRTESSGNAQPLSLQSTGQKRRQKSRHIWFS